MKTLAVWLWLAAACAASAASAEVVTVRSGDHPGFTRLVLSVPADRPWALTRSAAGYTLDTGNPADSYDLDGVYDRIQRNRIVALTAGATAGQLAIAVGCACHADAFQWLPDKVVVDIIDGVDGVDGVDLIDGVGGDDATMAVAAPDTTVAQVIPGGTETRAATETPVMSGAMPNLLTAPTTPEPALPQPTLPQLAGPAAPSLSEPTPAAPLDAFAMSAPPVLATIPAALGSVKDPGAAAALASLLPLLLPPPPGVSLPATDDFNVVQNAKVAGLPEFTSENSAANAISETEQAIIEGIGRAASQGLLDVAVSPSRPEAETQAMPQQPDPQAGPHAEPPPGPHAAPEPDPEPEAHAAKPVTLTDLQADLVPSTLAAFAMSGPDTRQPGLTAHTSVDNQQPDSGTTDHTTPQGSRCLDDSLLATETWGDDQPFAAQIATRLSGLTTEFDAYPDGAVEALARTYLYFGFGREAAQALALDKSDSQDRRILAAMARLVDEEPETSGLFAGQLGCATEVALWTALSRGTVDGTTENERIAARAGFRALPPMLRGHLGARLAQMFLEFGDADVARSILDTAEGHATADRPETDQTSAEITLETEGPEAAIAALTTMADVDIHLTPEGLVQLIDLTLGEGLVVDPALMSLADSMVFEHRGQPVAGELIAAQARALIAADAFDLAFALLAGDVSPLEEDRVAALRGAASLALTARADDPAFLNFAFDVLPETFDAAVENAIATRLVTLGFADRAEVVLQTAASGTDARDRRYLQAEIALQMAQYDRVATLLADLSDPRAAQIAARALTAQGEYAAAAAQTLPGQLDNADQAWRAGAWQTLEHSDDALLRAASAAVLAADDPGNPAAPLAAGRALLEDSTATRALTTELLDRFAVEPLVEATASN